MANADLTADPCEDFYQFACGKFIQTADIPKDRGSVSSSKLNENINFQLMKLLEAKDQDEKDPFQLARHAYRACMDVESQEKLGVEPLKAIIDQLMETQNNVDDSHWYDILSTLKPMGMPTNIIVSVSVVKDLRNSSKNIINVAETSLGLQQQFLLSNDSPVLHGYKQLLTEVFQLIDPTVSNDTIHDILDFERKLAKMIVPFESYVDNEVLSIGDLDEYNSDIPWLQFIRGMIGEETITRDEMVMLSNPF